MTSTTPSTTPVRALRLQRRQALHVALDAGTTLQVTAGGLLLRTPMRWLGETVVTPSVRLAEGECHRIEAGGWCALEALGDGVELRQHAPAPRWSWMSRWVRRAVALA
jgi:hypothetical protein